MIGIFDVGFLWLFQTAFTFLGVPLGARFWSFGFAVAVFDHTSFELSEFRSFSFFGKNKNSTTFDVQF